MKLNSKSINFSVDTVEELTSLDGVNGDICILTDEDRGGTFIYDDTAEDNQGTVFGYWRRQYDGAVNVKWFGSVDSQKINEIIREFNYLDFNNIEIELIKDTTLTSYNGGNPCIQIKNKDSVILENCLFICNVHAQGILDIVDSSNVIIRNSTFIGAGEFPELDGTTGAGEKAWDENAGYYSSVFGFGQSSSRNNAINTSSYTSGGYGGAFPQYDGTTSSSWGTWKGGGYIKNIGSGISIDNSTNVTIESCNISGFNFAGIVIGQQLQANSTNILITKNKIHSCYSMGISSFRLDKLVISDNNIYNIGHTSAQLTDDFSNPGYGYSSQLEATEYLTKNVIIANNTIKDCVRKGIDLHSGTNFTISNNIIENARHNGIALLGNQNDCKNIVVSNNLIKNCGQVINEYGEALLVVEGESITIDNNIIEDGEKNLLNLSACKKDIVVHSNTLSLTKARSSLSSILRIENEYNTIVTDNIIKDNGFYGSSLSCKIDGSSNSVIFQNNIIDTPTQENTIGFYSADTVSNSVIARNIVNVNATSTAYRARNTVLAFEGNMIKGTTLPDIILDYSTSGGKPIDTVVESGSNSNGEYIKLIDGTLICKRRADATAGIPITTSSGGIYTGTWGSITMPIESITPFKANVNWAGTSGSDTHISIGAVFTNTTGLSNVYLLSNISKTTTTYARLFIIAYGTWK